MQRVVVLGRGGAGKSTLAAALGERTGIPVVELDRVFWLPGLVPMRPDEWVVTQQQLIATASWILDGDLGPYDVLPPRLEAADTIVVLDFPLWRCVWRASRRSRERADFWWWVLRWRRQNRPALLASIRTHARDARVVLLRRPREVSDFLGSVAD